MHIRAHTVYPYSSWALKASSLGCFLQLRSHTEHLSDRVTLRTNIYVRGQSSLRKKKKNTKREAVTEQHWEDVIDLSEWMSAAPRGGMWNNRLWFEPHTLASKHRVNLWVYLEQRGQRSVIAVFWLSDRSSVVVVKHFLDVSTGMEKINLKGLGKWAAKQRG